MGIDGTRTAGVFFGTAASPSFRAFARVLGEPEGTSPLAFYTPRELSPENADVLVSKIRQTAERFGAKRLHLICHSKGGLDARHYLSKQSTPAEVRIRSLSTLSTPFHGSSLADLVWGARRSRPMYTSSRELDLVLRDDWFIQLRSPKEPGLTDLTTTEAERATRGSDCPSGVRCYNIGADADLDGSEKIELGEIGGMQIPSALVWNAVYGILGTVAYVYYTPNTDAEGNTYYTDVQFPTGSFQLNDLAVTTNSATWHAATYLGTEDANHDTMKSQSSASLLGGRLRADFPVAPNPAYPVIP